MPIVKKSNLSPHLAALQSRYQALVAAVQGQSPNENIYNQYCGTSDEFNSEYTEINELEVKLAVNDFEGILKELKTIKNLKAQKLHNPK